MAAPEVLDPGARDVPEKDMIETFGAGYGLFSGRVRGHARLRFRGSAPDGSATNAGMAGRRRAGCRTAAWN